ncbi:MAG: hypothetical protein HeimC3_47180 [Candidatus Heimdallarchaeota archaeon LC_3]|nr:MAG: hypothetical protein HeimC3_47180 [Candidatus Heimdallarchaeota archaeon LC_3]
MKIKADIVNPDLLLIKTISKYYFICRKFFKRHQDYQDQIQLKAKEYLLKNIQKEIRRDVKNNYLFFENENSDIKSGEDSNYSIILKTKKHSYNFPHFFIKYMDRLQNINMIPIKELDLRPLDRFMQGFSENSASTIDLDQYFDLLQQHLQLVYIPLRKREKELFNFLTSLPLYEKTLIGNKRLSLPDIQELHDLTGRSEYNLYRSLKFLLENNIVSIIPSIDYSRLNFTYYLIFNEKSNEFNNSLKNFIFWEMPQEKKDYYLVIIPPNRKEKFLSNYQPLKITKYYYNINLFDIHNRIEQKESNMLPDLNSFSARTSNYQKINLDFPLTPDNNLNKADIATLGRISTTSIQSIFDLNRFNQDIQKSTNSAIRSLREKDIIYYFPQVNHIGLTFQTLILTFSSSQLLENALHVFLSYPVSQCFIDETNTTLICAVWFPKEYLSTFLINARMFITSYSETQAKISLLKSARINQKIKISQNDADFI